MRENRDMENKSINSSISMMCMLQNSKCYRRGEEELRRGNNQKNNRIFPPRQKSSVL